MDKHDWRLALIQTIIAIAAVLVVVLIASCRADNEAAAFAPPPSSTATAAAEPTPPADSFPLTVTTATSGRIDGIIGVKVTSLARQHGGNIGDSLTVLMLLMSDPAKANHSHIIVQLKIMTLGVRYFDDVPADQSGWVSFVIGDGIKHCFDGACNIDQAEVHLHSLDELH